MFYYSDSVSWFLSDVVERAWCVLNENEHWKLYLSASLLGGFSNFLSFFCFWFSFYFFLSGDLLRCTLVIIYEVRGCYIWVTSTHLGFFGVLLSITLIVPNYTIQYKSVFELLLLSSARLITAKMSKLYFLKKKKKIIIINMFVNTMRRVYICPCRSWKVSSVLDHRLSRGTELASLS